jgi:ribosomal protein S18 acetylase RimI-like enzyme
LSFDIVPFEETRREEVIRLVDRVFPSQGLVERLSMRVFQTRWDWLLKRVGIRDGRFWLATKDDAVIGTVGLYSTPKDAASALWLGWFCVSPEARGQKVGQALIDFAVGKASAEERQFLRLYTSTDPNEAAAQSMYERNRFGLVGESRPLLWRFAASPVKLLFRERRLSAPA